MADWADKWNVPGAVEYKPTRPLDTILRARTDQELRGYWLGYDLEDGQVCLISNQNDADHLVIDTDVDGVPVIRYTDETTEFSTSLLGEYQVIRVKRYS